LTGSRAEFCGSLAGGKFSPSGRAGPPPGNVALNSLRAQFLSQRFKDALCINCRRIPQV